MFRDILSRRSSILRFDSICEITFNPPKSSIIVTESSYSYDFRLDSLSTAIDKGDPATAPPIDRNGLPRDERPDIGAYEYKKPS